MNKMQVEIIPHDTTDICRTCLALKGVLVSIYDPRVCSEGSYIVADMLNFLATIPPTWSDGLPDKVCLECLEEVNRCFAFKRKCDNTDRKLRYILKSNQSLRLESKTNIIYSVLDKEMPSKKLSAGVHLRKSNEFYPAITVVGTDVTNKENSKDGDVESFYSFDLTQENIKEKRVDSESNKYKSAPKLSDWNGTKLMCPVCSKTFLHPESKRQHLSEFHKEIESRRYDEKRNEKPEIVSNKKYKYHCPLCTTSFLDSKTLTAHILSQKCANKQHKSQNDELGSTSDEEELESSQCQEEEFENKYHSPLCTTGFLGPKALTAHILEQKCTNKQSQSDESESTSNEDESESTQKSKEEPVNKYHCPLCTAGFLDPKSLTAHILEQKCSDKQLRYQNDEPKSTSNKQNRSQNIKLESSSSKEAYQESEQKCTIKRNLLIRLRKLKLTIHPQRKKFPCAFCDHAFASVSDLCQHKAEQHETEQNFQCSICRISFQYPSSLGAHVRIHITEGVFSCPICKKNFLNLNKLMIHKLNHAELKPFKCKTCAYSFRTEAELDAHSRRHKGENFCVICFRTFSSWNCLAKHKLTHAGYKDRKLYGCDLCPMRFSKYITCQKHQQTHTMERPFRCKICQTAFKQLHQCVNHMQIHGQWKYICAVCDKRFRRAYSLRSHSKMHIN